MADRPTKLQRWLDIIAYLVGRRLPVSMDELMRRVPAYSARWQTGSATDRESVRRSFERDKDELRALGIPIRTVPYYTADAGERIDGYALSRRDFYLPYLRLVQEAGAAPPYPEPHRAAEVEVARTDAPLALEALRRVAELPGFPFQREARSAFRKLAFDLDPAQFAPQSPVLFVDPPGVAAQTRALRQLSDALLVRKRVRFRYEGIYRGEPTRRDVAGWGLFFQHAHWYLVGHDALRDDVRVFRVSRMSELVVETRAPGTPDYEVPADFRLEDYAGREAWELGEAEDALVAHVLFRFPLSLWAGRNEYGTFESRASDGSETRSFDVRQVDPFLRWVLSLEGEAAIVQPRELREQLQAMARAVVAAHGGTP